MRKLNIFLILLLSMVMVPRHVIAQEVVIPLNPGWTWFGYPRADTLDVETAMQSITPTEGDQIQSQNLYSSYLNGHWVGTLQQLIPGMGFMYKSMNASQISLVFSLSDSGLPKLATTVVTKVGDSFISGGNVTSDGGSPVTARGICYGNYPNPDLSSTFTHTDNGSGSGNYTSFINNSVSGTIYVRAYATNANGTVYGEQVIANIDYLNLPTFDYNGYTYVVAPDPQQTFSEYINHNTAYYYCENLTAYGYSDWKMPDIYELEMMYQCRESIGGFVQSIDSYNQICYHSLSWPSSTSAGHYKLLWDNGLRVTDVKLENVGTVSYSNNDNNYLFNAHVRPIRLQYVLPTVTTNSVYNIYQTSAYCDCNVVNDGGATVTERGVCWSTGHNPTISNSHHSNGSGTGNYVASVSNLIPGTQYYARAYAVNSAGTAYGEEIGFATPCAPTVTTNDVVSVTPNSATCGGNVINSGSATVTARGVCWSKYQNPTISASYSNDGAGVGNYTSTITGLKSSTKYYVRAYATNSVGTTYGSEMSFTTPVLLLVSTDDVTGITQTSATCGGNITTDYDATVTARGVCWSTTNQSPTISDNCSSEGVGVGSFTSNLYGLTQNTTYYIRAYATTSEGTVYGNTQQFTTTKLSYRISQGGVVSTSAGGYFYDSGGPDNYYSNNEHYIMTFVSNQGAGSKIQMTFTEFLTESDADYLVIYDGMNTSAPIIGTYYYTDEPGTVTATNDDGALTFVWISDSSSTRYGWKAAISIVY